MSCFQTKKYYDIDLLQKAVLPIDDLIHRIYASNIYRLKPYIRPSVIYESFHDITPELVNAFQHEAFAHILHIRNQLEKYGYLYFVEEKKSLWFNVVHFEYENFPLMRDPCKTLAAVRKIAERKFIPETSEFNATCLYLMYFFGLLVNPHSTWITMDYLTNGNRYHQYGTRLEGKLLRTVREEWS